MAVGRPQRSRPVNHETGLVGHVPLIGDADVNIDRLGAQAPEGTSSRMADQLPSTGFDQPADLLVAEPGNAGLDQSDRAGRFSAEPRQLRESSRVEHRATVRRWSGLSNRVGLACGSSAANLG